MIPHVRPSLLTRIKAWLHGIDLENAAPINDKGGPLRALVSRLAHSPVYGMERIEGHWWAHTARGWHPLNWYIEQATRELPGVTLTFEELQAMGRGRR